MVFVSAITANGFRNLNGRVDLAHPLAVLLGENNTGKSNVVDALRLLLTPEAGPRGRLWISADDFQHDEHGARGTDRFELAVEFGGLTSEDEARMITCLAPSLGGGRARLKLVASLRPDGRVDTEWYGGDSTRPDVEPWAREATTFTYLHPLRDASADLRPGRGNRLVDLLTALAPNGHADRGEIEQIAADANSALDHVATVADARTRVQGRVDSMVGAGPFAQRTDIRFAEAQFDRIVGTLRAMAGAVDPLELGENGLGYNNLLYMAVLLAGLSARTDGSHHVLLVEEPEAHLHPQLQDLLMRHLEDQGAPSQQVIVTSHSPNFASAARIERTTILVAQPIGQPTVARSPASFGLDDKQLRYLHRFLDVTKAALLFARAVVLVEGIAEQLLLPALARRLGTPLPPTGVSVINVGGVAFEPFIKLFGPTSLPYRCAVVSDLDPVVADSAQVAGDEEAPTAGGEGQPAAIDDALTESSSARATRLQGLQNESVRVFLASRTLEWDLVASGNWETLLSVLARLRPRVAARLQADLQEADAASRADAFLEAVKPIKGPFAQELADAIDVGTVEAFFVPGYLREAIDWALGVER